MVYCGLLWSPFVSLLSIWSFECSFSCAQFLVTYSRLWFIFMWSHLVSCGPLWSVLSSQVERLEEEKLALRKRLVDVQLSGAGGSGRDSVDGGDKGGRGGGGERGGGGGGGGESEGGQDETDDAFVAKDDLTPVVAQLRTQVLVYTFNVHVHVYTCVHAF